MTEVEYKEAEHFYEKFKKAIGYDPCEGTYDIFELMTEYSNAQNQRLTYLINEKSKDKNKPNPDSKG